MLTFDCFWMILLRSNEIDFSFPRLIALMSYACFIRMVQEIKNQSNFRNKIHRAAKEGGGKNKWVRDALGKKRRLGDFFHKVWKRPKEEKTKKQKQDEGMQHKREEQTCVWEIKEEAFTCPVVLRRATRSSAHYSVMRFLLCLQGWRERARERERARLLLHRHPAWFEWKWVRKRESTTGLVVF